MSFSASGDDFVFDKRNKNILSRTFLMSERLKEFEVDPRGRPDFTSVFIMQENMLGLVAVASWFHTIYLIYVLSTLNDVYG